MGAPGSALYYSFLYLRPDIRRALYALYAFRYEQQAILGNIADENVARTRLGWWHEEVQRYRAGAPRHPVTRALGQSEIDVAETYPPLIEVLTAISNRIGSSDFQSPHERVDFCRHTGAAIATAAARICGFEHECTLEHLGNIGIGVELTELLANLPRPMRAGTLNREAKPDSDEIADQISRARQHLTRGRDSITGADRYRQLGGLTMAAIYLLTLRRIERSKHRVMETPLNTTPLTKFWTAWRTERAERKHRSDP